MTLAPFPFSLVKCVTARWSLESKTGKVHLVATPEVKCDKAMSGSDMSHVLLHRGTHLAYMQPQSDCDSDGK